jgi:hypothetical protein
MAGFSIYPLICYDWWYSSLSFLSGFPSVINFPPIWINCFSISWSVGLLVMKSLSFLWSRNLTSFIEEYFHWLWNPKSQYFLVYRYLHCFLWAVFCHPILAPCYTMWVFFFLNCMLYNFLKLYFQQFDYNVPMHDFLDDWYFSSVLENSQL